MRRNLLAAAFSLMMLTTTLAQTTTKPVPGTTSGTITGRSSGAFFALSVNDVETVSRWYQEKLGFRVLSQGEAPNKIAKGVILEGDGTIIELIQHREAKPFSAVAPEAKGAYQVHGIFKIGMVVEDIDVVYREIKKRGVPIAYDLVRTKDVPMRSFSIRDVEGNMIQFFGK